MTTAARDAPADAGHAAARTRVVTAVAAAIRRALRFDEYSAHRQDEDENELHRCRERIAHKQPRSYTAAQNKEPAVTDYCFVRKTARK